MVSDQCHGNKDNRVAASFSSCAKVYLLHELFYIETQIALFYLWYGRKVKHNKELSGCKINVMGLYGNRTFLKVAQASEIQRG